MSERKPRKRKKSGQGRKSAGRSTRRTRRTDAAGAQEASAEPEHASLLGTSVRPSLRPQPAGEPPAPMPARSPSRPTTRRKPEEPRSTRPSTAHELMRHVHMPKLPEPPLKAPVRPQRPKPEAPLTMAQIYEALAALLVPYARKMESEMHPKIGFCLKARSARTGRETHFGAVQAMPDGVAYHLFPLYGHPDLLEDVTPDLFNRMRGKTCFHFEDLTPALLAELSALTHAGFERFLADGVL